MKKRFIFLTLLFAGLAALPLRAADTDVLTKNKVLHKLIQQTGVTGVSPDGKHLASGSAEGVVRLWDLAEVAQAAASMADAFWSTKDDA